MRLILAHHAAVEGERDDCEHDRAGGRQGGEVDGGSVEVHHQRRAYVYVNTVSMGSSYMLSHPQRSVGVQVDALSMARN